MSEFAESWQLSRKRFVDAIAGMTQQQLNWRLHEGTLTIGEMALHVAGVEVSFSSQLLGIELSEDDQRLKRAATDGVVNEKEFPYSAEEITPDRVAAGLARGETLAGPMLQDPSAEVRSKEIVSALGPVITGEGAMARLGFHAGYHQGQVHLIATAPGFPR